jgi:hypothetical protein
VGKAGSGGISAAAMPHFWSRIIAEKTVFRTREWCMIQTRSNTGFSGSIRGFKNNGFTPSLREAVVEVLSKNPILERN